LYVSMGNCLGRRSKLDNSLSSQATSGNVSGPCSCCFYYMQVDESVCVFCFVVIAVVVQSCGLGM